jgi:hypothetical protein
MIIVSAPTDSTDTLRKAIGEAGGGKLGDYSFCSFSYTGKARFLPNRNADPAIGDPGRLEVVEEERIEVVCDEADMKAVVHAIHKAHPYEDPVIAAYALLDLN